MRSFLSSLILFALSASAFAVDPCTGPNPLPQCTVPEPGSLALLGIAAAAGIGLMLAKKRKK